MGVCTCTTPDASFSINIPGPTLEPEIGQSNYWAAIIAGARCNGKPFFSGLTNILMEPQLSLYSPVHDWEILLRMHPEMGLPQPSAHRRVRWRLREGCPCDGSGPPPQIRVLLPPREQSSPGNRPSTSRRR